jgi:two-component system, OmpR family, sensor kinase
MRQPRSIRFHLTAVFLVFFLLVVVLGFFSIWRLSHFNRLSSDVAEIWLPTTRSLGDLNNFTSDFRAIEGSNLLSTDTVALAATEAQMTGLDRSIAEAERSFEHIPRNASGNELYDQFKQHWNDYRRNVNQIVALSRSNRKAEALAVYDGASRDTYDAASEALGRLTDRAVADAAAASERLGAAYRQAFWLILLGIVIAGVMVVAALIHVRRSISAPLLQLAGRMRQLAANNTEISIPETERRDEIGEMAQAAVVFRNNAIELMRSQRTLARQATMLEEQLAHEQRLALAQRNFISTASHEFRTPLTIVDGHARRLEKTRTVIKPDDIGERAGKIRGAVLRLTHLIDTMLSSARLMDGGAELYFYPVELDLTSVLREACQVHREMVPGAEITEKFGNSPMPMIGDAKLLFQLFSNLLSNAVKYSPNGGVVEVDIRNINDHAAVTVVDRGIGIPPGDVGRLFERYYRGSNVSGIVGTGVGLHLVKMAVELHRGRIEVMSQEGNGSRFTVYLPLRQALIIQERSLTEAVPDSPSIAVSSNSIT